MKNGKGPRGLLDEDEEGLTATEVSIGLDYGCGTDNDGLLAQDVAKYRRAVVAKYRERIAELEAELEIERTRDA